jgi:hypothetical protein
MVKEHAVANPGKQHYEGDEEIIKRNIEGSKEVIANRKRAVDEQETEHPVNAAQQDLEQDRPPGQTDVPAGGTSGPNSAGGSSKRHKPDG